MFSAVGHRKDKIMNTYIVTRWDKVKSQKTIKAKSEEQALKQIDDEGFDESLDEVVSSEIEIEKESYAKWNQKEQRYETN